jgi:hypothetical protein
MPGAGGVLKVADFLFGSPISVGRYPAVCHPLHFYLCVEFSQVIREPAIVGLVMLDGDSL